MSMDDGVVVADKAALKVTALVTAALWGKFFLTVSGQGKQRFLSSNRPPEDGRWGIHNKEKPTGFGLNDSPASMKEQVEKQQRWDRIVMNDLENIPIGLIVSWASAFVSGLDGTSDGFSTLHIVGVLMFGVGRVGHTISYINALQPHRTWSYATALLGVFLMLISLIGNVF